MRLDETSGRHLAWRATVSVMLALAAIGGPATPTTAAESTDVAVDDGEPWIVYQRYEGGGHLHLRMIRPDGGGDHRLVPEVEGAQVHPDWSPDGRRIAFSVGDPGAIWVVDADGTDAERILECAEPCGLIDAPAWSPDGGSIAFLRILFPPDEISYALVQVLDLATGVERTAFKPEPGLEASWYMRWSPDSEEMVISLEHYESADSDIIDSSVIAVIDADDPEAPPRILTEPGMFASYPDWSPDGERIVFSTYDLGFRDFGNYVDRMPASNLYTIAPDGSDLRQLTHYEPGDRPIRNGTASGDLASQPTWTPDGERIIFVNVTGYGWPGWGMATIAADGSDLAPAAGDTYWNGTHPRLRPVPRYESVSVLTHRVM